MRIGVSWAVGGMWMREVGGMGTRLREACKIAKWDPDWLNPERYKNSSKQSKAAKERAKAKATPVIFESTPIRNFRLGHAGSYASSSDSTSAIRSTIEIFTLMFTQSRISHLPQLPGGFGRRRS